MSGSVFLRRDRSSFVFAFAAVAWVLAAVIPAMAHQPATDDTQRAAPATIEPFGRRVSELLSGPLQAKWRDVERAIARDLDVIAQCRRERDACTSQPAMQFLKIIDGAAAQSGLARVGEINRAFNLTIRPVSDLTQYGVEDMWTSPLTTLASSAGDCEDYAIAKMVALREAGWSADDLRLVILREASGEDHAVAAARVEGRWRILDNRSFAMIEDSDVTKYQPVFAIDAEGAKRFEDPALAIAAAATVAPTGNVPVAIQLDAGPSPSTISHPATQPDNDDLWSVTVM